MATANCEPITHHYPNAVVRVYRKPLTDEENARWLQQVHDAAARLLKSQLKPQKEARD